MPEDRNDTGPQPHEKSNKVVTFAGSDHIEDAVTFVGSTAWEVGVRVRAKPERSARSKLTNDQFNRRLDGQFAALSYACFQPLPSGARAGANSGVRSTSSATPSKSGAIRDFS
jgi:hypothetical protein